MSSNIDIILRVKDDGSVTLQKVATNLKGLGEAAQQADASLKKAATGSNAAVNAMQKVDAAGRQTRIGFSAAAQAADLFGVNIAGIVGPAAQAADAMGDIVGMAASFNPIGLVVAGVGLAIGGVITLMRQQQEEAAKALEATRKYEEGLRATFEAARNAINELMPKDDPLAGLANSIPLAVERLRELAASSDEARDKINRLLTSQEGARVLEDRIAKLQTHMRELNDAITQQQALIAQRTEAGIVTAEDIAKLQELQADLQNSSNMMRVYQEALAGAKTAQDALTASVKTMGDEALTSADKFALLAGNINAAAYVSSGEFEKYPDAFQRITNAGTGMNEVFARGKTVSNELNDAAKKLAADGLNAAAQAAKRVYDTVRSMVENALQPTAVTMEDMNASLAGKYIPKWDEFRRRVEAVATGSGIEQFGPRFKTQLDMVQGMFKDLNLDQIAAKFKDFSLFADMNTDQIKSLIDFGPIEQQVAAQVDSIIGKAKAMKVAFDEVWSSLSTQKKIDLAQAFGMDASAANIEGLKTKIAGAVTGATTGVADAATAGLTSGLSAASTKADELGKTITTKLGPGVADLKKNLDPLIPSLQSTGDTLTKATNPAFAALDGLTKNILASLQSTKTALDDDLKSFDAWVSGMPNYETAMQALITNALEPLRTALSSIVSELENIIDKANEAAAALAGMNGGGTGSGTAPTNTTPTPGFATGGRFMVGGRPGTDTNLVSFRATRGEMVTITPPGAHGRAGSQFAFDFRGANFAGADAGTIDYLIASLSRMFDGKMDRLALSAYNFDAFNGN